MIVPFLEVAGSGGLFVGLGTAIGTAIAVILAWRADRSAKASKNAASKAEGSAEAAAVEARAAKAKDQLIDALERRNQVLDDEIADVRKTSGEAETVLNNRINIAMRRITALEDAERICQEERAVQARRIESLVMEKANLQRELDIAQGMPPNGNGV